MAEDKLKKLEAGGTAFETGQQHGSQLKEEIQVFVDQLYQDLEKDGAPKEKAKIHTRKYLPYIEEYSAEAAREMEGIASGAEVDYEDIVMIALNEEIQSFAPACTAFAATGRATAEGYTILGQTWDDFYSWFDDVETYVLAKNYQDSDLQVLSYIYPGMMSCAGINSAGIAISWNTVPRLDLKSGVPTYVIVNEVLKQKTIGKALSAVVSADRAGCFNFVIADESEIYNVEATPDDFEITYSSTYLGHANHYTGDKFSSRQDLGEFFTSGSASSIIRHNRIGRLLRENSGSIDLETARSFFTDHVNHPDSICRHPDPDLEVKTITRSAWAMVPALREFWITAGPPCEYDYIKYSL